MWRPGSALAFYQSAISSRCFWEGVVLFLAHAADTSQNKAPLVAADRLLFGGISVEAAEVDVFPIKAEGIL